MFHITPYSRATRATGLAIPRLRKHLEDGAEWVVDIDLSKFFDTVNHDRLMQGGPLSPLLSNIVLDELDQELERRGHCFVRYADDCNVYVKTERSGHRVMASLTDFMERKMKLRVTQNKSEVARPKDRQFLGLTLRKLKSGRVRIVVSRDGMKALRTKLKEMTPRNWGAPLDDCIARASRYLRGWLGYFGIADATYLGAEDAHLRRRLRAIQLKQWKKKRLIVRHLIALGSPPAIARDVYGRHRGWWALSAVRGVTWALRNSYYTKRGLYDLKANWEKTHERIWNIGPEQQVLPMG